MTADGVQARAEAMAAAGGFLGGRLQDFERIGRHQLEVLLHEGLRPDSNLADVGCGSLRAGYWFLHFLEPGHYFGIEPRVEEVEAGLAHVVDADLVARAQPRFDHNEDFDLAVFGVPFDFVVARSIWTHTSKAQIGQLLDSFDAVAAPGGVLLASYLPASKLPDPVREPLYGAYRRIPKFIEWRRRIRGRRLKPGDYQGDEWRAELVGHRFDWIEGECARRSLRVRELDHGMVNSQVWLRIERA